MTINITAADLSVFNGEPTILDLCLAELLGYDRDRDIRKLIQRNMDELQKYGEVCATVAQTSVDGGRPATEYHLSEGQALLIATLSKTEKAAQVRYMLIMVFLEWRRGNLAAARPAPPDAFEIDIQYAPLSAKTEYLKLVWRLRGREAAVAMMPQLGLPDLNATIACTKIAAGGKECLEHLLNWRDEEGDRIRDLIEAAQVHGREWNKRLAIHGIRVPQSGEPGILVASATRPVAKIYDGTPWALGAHRAAFNGLQGVETTNPMKFGREVSRAYFIPAGLFTAPVAPRPGGN